MRYMIHPHVYNLLCQQGRRPYWPTGFSEYARRQSECPPATSLSAASTWWGVPGRDMADLTGDQRRSAALVASCGLFSCLVGALWAILGPPGAFRFHWLWFK